MEIYFSMFYLTGKKAAEKILMRVLSPPAHHHNHSLDVFAEKSIKC